MDPGQYNYRAVTNVLIANNTIEKACDGGWDEQLDIAKGNQIFNIRRYAIYLDAGASDPTYYRVRPGLPTNIAVFDNLIHNNDARGIGITSEGRGNIDGIKVFNNVCYSNGCDGILLYHYPGTTNYARNITIIDNTTYNNNTSPTTPYYGGIATDHDTAQNVIVRNNIAFENFGFGIKQPWNPATVMDHNITSNPAFRNPARGDFHLQSNSPAVDGGSPVNAPLFDFDGSARPAGSAFDAGAFEYIPPAPVKLHIRRVPEQLTYCLALQGGPQSHYRIEWKTGLDSGAWNLLLDIPSLPRSPYSLYDSEVLTVPGRFYRAFLMQ